MFEKIGYIVFYCFLILGCICAGLNSCATNRGGTGDSWGDAALIAEQRVEIAGLKSDIERMGEYQQQISDGIDSITAGLIDGLERCGTIEDIFREVDDFVRKLIEQNNQLRAILRTDRPENAGKG